MEAIFEDIRSRLNGISKRVRIAPFLSDGVIRRILIMLDAFLHQGEISHVTGDINFAAILLSKKSTVLTILDCNGADENGFRGWAYRTFWLRLPVGRAAIVTTISDSAKRDIVRLTRCHPSKVVVTGVAISSIFKRMDRPFHESCPTILQIGTSPHKNIERLAAALEGICCRLVVLGKLKSSQLKALQQFKIEYTNFFGLDAEEVVSKYAESDIVAFVSTYEGFGMPILEGNAIGRPVVTSNCASMPEVAGDAACIVDPFDVASIRHGIVRIMSDASYRDRLRKCGFANAKRFEPDAVADRYLRVYKSICK